MRARALAGAVITLCSLGCTNFPEIEAGVCGNVVLDPNEACDTKVDAEFKCRPPGDPFECQYDCRPRADGSQQLCPSEYGCARDGVCRRDRGEYEEPVTISSEVTSWLSVTNFDGDDRLDLISAEPPDQSLQARFRVHYFDVDGRLLETRLFPRVTSRPVSRDMDGDGREDLLFNTYRVGMVPGRADREWLPASFSSYRISNSSLRVLNVREDLVGLGTPLAALANRGGRNGIFVPDYFTAGLKPILDLPSLVEELVGAPLAANLREGIESPCDELVVAYRGDHHVRVIDLCRLEPDPALPEVMWRDEPLEQLVSLPFGAEVDRGPLAADVNGDGHLDLVLGGTVGSEHATFVAYGDGQQLAALAEPLKLELDPVTTESFYSGLNDAPIAAGDLSGDGRADFVLPNVVLCSRQRLGTSDVLYGVTYQNLGEPWTAAELGDLNGNGSLDLVAAAAGFPGLTIVNGSPASQLVGVGLPTDGPVQFISTGDFDGDLVRDVAYIESGKPTTERSDFLSIAFGKGLGTPDIGRRIAAVSGAEQLGNGIDRGLDVLFMVTNEHLARQSVGALTLFEGNAERLPLAPYSLVPFESEGTLDNDGAVALIAGSFAAPGRNDLIALGNHQDRAKLPEQVLVWSQWLLPSIASAGTSPIRLTGELPPGAQPVEPGEGKARLVLSGAAFDIDGDARDEAVWLLSEKDGQGCVLAVYDIDVRSEVASEREASRIHFGEPCVAPELRVLLADRGEPKETGEITPKAALAVLVGSKLRLLWSDGSGRLSLEQSLEVPIPGDEAVRAFALSPDSKRLAAVTPSSLYVVRNLEEDDAVKAKSSLPTHPAWDQVKRVPYDLANATSVAVIDPNKDDVPAIAVADEEGIRLFEARLR